MDHYEKRVCGHSGMKSTAAVIFGGYINGYNIVKSLAKNNVKNIILIDVKKRLARHSRYVSEFIEISYEPNKIYNCLTKLKEKYNYLVLYPTDDEFLSSLVKIESKVKAFCFCPFNQNYKEMLSKKVQYELAKSVNVPIPKTMGLIDYLEKFNNNEKSLMYPIIVKPEERLDIVNNNIKRNIVYDSEKDFINDIPIYKEHIKSGVSFIVSEVIPGKSTQIFTYTAYQSSSGQILGEWCGQKLSQFPNDFGVFSSAKNIFDHQLINLGRQLFNVMKIQGIAVPEFKYDNRDQKYKLMEVNLRPQMFHGLGDAMGVNLPYIQWCDALNIEVESNRNKEEKVLHYVFFRHECLNLLNKKKYWPTFIHNLFGGDIRVFAVFRIADPWPFIYSVVNLVKSISLKRVIKRVLFR